MESETGNRGSVPAASPGPPSYAAAAEPPKPAPAFGVRNVVVQDALSPIAEERDCGAVAAPPAAERRRDALRRELSDAVLPQRKHFLLRGPVAAALAAFVALAATALTFALPFIPVFWIGTAVPLRPYIGFLETSVEVRLPLTVRSLSWINVHVNELHVVAWEQTARARNAQPFSESSTRNFNIAPNSDTDISVFTNVTINRQMDIGGISALALQCLAYGYANVTVQADVHLRGLDWLFVPKLEAQTSAPCPVSVGPWVQRNYRLLRKEARALYLRGAHLQPLWWRPRRTRRRRTVARTERKKV